MSDGPLILMVANDTLLGTQARETLQSEGFEFAYAEEGQQALAKLQEILLSKNKERAIVVLIDAYLANGESFDLCREMYTLVDGTTISILLLLNADDKTAMEQGHQVGACDFLLHPIDWMIASQHLHYIVRNAENTKTLFQGIKNLRIVSERMRKAQHLARLGYWQLNPTTGEMLWSDEMFEIFNLQHTGGAVNIKKFYSLIHPDDGELVKNFIGRTITNNESWQIEHRILPVNGTEKTVLSEAQFTSNFSKHGGLVSGILQDITQRKLAEPKYNYLAYYNRLTELPNRHNFEAKLQKAINRALAENYKIGIILLDINHFYRINDTFGHAVGDRLLKEFGKRIKITIHDIEHIENINLHNALVAHFGADEFIILINQLDENINLEQIANNIITATSQPLLVGRQEIILTISVGISTFPKDGDKADIVIRNADIARYAAKENGGNSICYYAEDLNALAIERFSLESQLRRAIECKSFIVYYQPKVDLTTGKISGMEALVRWPHEQSGFIPPSKFIPIAEESGLIIPLGEAILLDACKQMRQWLNQGFTDLTLSVNLSTKQFTHPNLLNSIFEILQMTRLPPECLEFEITESTVMKNEQEAIVILNSLKELGSIIAIDDFGSGYSSFGYLKRLPLDVLKIDISFIKDITLDPDNENITKAIIAMAHNLDLKVVAEGVSTKGQFNLLQELSCNEAQGFLFSPAIPAEEFTKLINQKKIFGK